MESITTSIVGCARCHGEGHEALTFEPLAHPVPVNGGMDLTHWAPCPTNGEPILLGAGPPPEILPATVLADEQRSFSGHKLEPLDHAYLEGGVLAVTYRVSPGRETLEGQRLVQTRLAIKGGDAQASLIVSSEWERSKPEQPE